MILAENSAFVSSLVDLHCRGNLENFGTYPPRDSSEKRLWVDFSVSSSLSLLVYVLFPTSSADPNSPTCTSGTRGAARTRPARCFRAATTRDRTGNGIPATARRRTRRERAASALCGGTSWRFPSSGRLSQDRLAGRWQLTAAPPSGASFVGGGVFVTTTPDGSSGSSTGIAITSFVR
jgi:hypothetical protein